MYIWDGKFRTAVAYIDGYNFALIGLMESDEGRTELATFRAWLAQRFYLSHRLARNLVWWGYIVYFTSEDDKAFEMLRTLFAEFLQEKDEWQQIDWPTYEEPDESGET